MYGKRSWNKGNYKYFENSVHEQTDSVAKEAGIKLFTSMFPWLFVEENEDKYGVDLFLKDDTGKVVGAIEVEIKLVWEGKFSYNSLHFPERKKKFVNGSTYFVVFDKNVSQCFVVTGEELLESPLKEVKNYKIPRGEYFYNVPIHKCFYYDLSDESLWCRGDKTCH